ncbi:MAG: hypothetical protein ABIO80_00225 [Sphingomicrobium sp.]
MKFRLIALPAVMLLSACQHAGDLVDESGSGVYAVRSSCPIAGVPAGTGDITLFNPPESTDSRAIDVTAAISDVRATCQTVGNDSVSVVTFTITALRRDNGAARQVALPYFNLALRGGATISAKTVHQASLNFAAGSSRSWARLQAVVRVNRGAASLPANVRAILTRPRKSGETQAAVDPLAEPGVRAAVANATFEHLIGFQLTTDQLKYNVTR